MLGYTFRRAVKTLGFGGLGILGLEDEVATWVPEFAATDTPGAPMRIVTEDQQDPSIQERIPH